MAIKHSASTQPSRGFWASIGHFLLLCMGHSDRSLEDPADKYARLSSASMPDSEDDACDWAYMHDDD